MTSSLRNLLVVAALSFVPIPVSADVIVPGALAAVEGNSNNGFPFNSVSFSSSEMRYQQVYAASEFGSDPLLIDAILFRPDSQNGNPFLNSYANIRVDLSTTSAAPDGLSSTFANNVGADNTTVRSGPFTLSSLDVAGPGNTREFDILIPFIAPFLYNPTLGNLLLDVRLVTNTASTQFDAHVVSGDSISRAWAYDDDALTSLGTDSSGLVTKFQTSSVNAVPDPGSSLSLLLMGIGSVFAARRFTKSN